MHDACRPKSTLIIAALLLILGCDAAQKQPPAADGNSESDRAASLARAVEITGKMLERYRKADSYTDNASYVEQTVVRSEGVEREMTYYEMSLAFARPNRIRVAFSEAVPAIEGAEQGFEFASDGELVRATLPEIPDQMVESPAPAKLDAAHVWPDPLIAQKLFNRPLSEVFPQVAMLLNDSDEDEAAVFAHDANPRMLADADLHGHKCYRVATSNPEGTRVFWIDAEDYTLHRMELPVESVRRQMDPERIYLKFAVRIDFKNPTFDSSIDRPSFVIEPQAGVRRVTNFVLPEKPPEGQGAAIETDEAETDAAVAEEGERDAEGAAEDAGEVDSDQAGKAAEDAPQDEAPAEETPADDGASTEDEPADAAAAEEPAMEGDAGEESENPLRRGKSGQGDGELPGDGAENQ